MLNLIRTMTVVSIRTKQMLCILLLYHEFPYFSMKMRDWYEFLLDYFFFLCYTIS